MILLLHQGLLFQKFLHHQLLLPLPLLILFIRLLKKKTQIRSGPCVNQKEVGALIVKGLTL